MKRVLLLGSTGSIGTAALNVIRANKNDLCVVGLVCKKSYKLLAGQAAEFGVGALGLYDAEFSEALCQLAPDADVFTGVDALTSIIEHTMPDIVVVAVEGIIGLLAVHRAVSLGIKTAIANKESIVAGGGLIMPLAREKGVEIVPVDSEHSAVWQCLKNGGAEKLKRIVLTASGGAFFGKTQAELREVTPVQAATHPTWRMGRKITVDCSTMFNKALELIEARRLFDTKCVDYVIHRQSIIHGLVEYNDGSILAQMSVTSMEIPIAAALGVMVAESKNILGLEGKTLTFEKPDESVFRPPALAKQLIQTDSDMLYCVFNAANEAAVDLFLNGRLGFCDIYSVVESAVGDYCGGFENSLEGILSCDCDVKKSIYDKFTR